MIFGGSSEKRHQYAENLLTQLNLKLNENEADLFVIDKTDDKKSIGIDFARSAKKFISERPLKGSTKAIVIKNAHLLTIQAQNALLKTIEEPPAYATILILVKNEDALLETIASRCKRISVGKEDFMQINTAESEKFDIVNLLNTSPGERISWVETFSKQNKDEIVQELENWILTLRKTPTVRNANNIKTIQKVKADLENINMNTRLALEMLMINIE